MIFRQDSADIALPTRGLPGCSVPFLAIRKAWRFSVLGKLRFVRPLFSWSYKLLSPQLLYFVNNLRCPPGVGGLLSPSSSVSACKCPKSFPGALLRTLCTFQKAESLCSQSNPHSFGKTPGVGGGSPFAFTVLTGPLPLRTSLVPLLP